MHCLKYQEHFGKCSCNTYFCSKAQIVVDNKGPSPPRKHSGFVTLSQKLFLRRAFFNMAIWLSSSAHATCFRINPSGSSMFDPLDICWTATLTSQHWLHWWIRDAVQLAGHIMTYTPTPTCKIFV